VSPSPSFFAPESQPLSPEAKRWLYGTDVPDEDDEPTLAVY
jgi:hypothetical protein